MGHRLPLIWHHNNRTWERDKNYDIYELSVVEGFSGVDTIDEIQRVWHLFQTVKNMDTRRLNRGNVMKEWATHMSVEIDDSVYFNKSTIEDIVNLHFNPGGCLATFKSAEKGISFLACTPCT